MGKMGIYVEWASCTSAMTYLQSARDNNQYFHSYDVTGQTTSRVLQPPPQRMFCLSGSSVYWSFLLSESSCSSSLSLESAAFMTCSKSVGSLSSSKSSGCGWYTGSADWGTTLN
jgi:hypothetical protein